MASAPASPATTLPRVAAPPLAPLLTALLGVAWLVDGILQLQPKMFGHAFIDDVLAPTREGQPAFMVHVVNAGIRVVEANIAVANAVAAAIQLAIGLLLLLPVQPRWRRAALWGSVAWAVVVWVFGEGAGGLLTGSASVFTGAPGSVLLYLILALALLFPARLPLARLPQVAGVLFLLGAALNAFPAFWRGDAARSALLDAARSDSYRWVAAPANQLARVATSAVAVNLIAIGLLLVFGVLLLAWPSRLVGGVTIVFLVLVWWLAQDFGGLLTFPHGTATDPNSAPLLMLLVLPACLTASYPRWASGLRRRWASRPASSTPARSSTATASTG